MIYKAPKSECWPHFLRCRIRSVRKPEKNTFSITPPLYDAAFPGNSREYPYKHCQNLESLGYIVVADSVVYLHSNFRGGL